MMRWLEGAVVLPGRVVANGLVGIDGRQVTGVYDLETERRPAACDERTVERIGEGYIAPGFIDLHVHGGGGGDFMDGDPESVVAITTTHARFGTTGMLATTLTGSEEAMIQGIRAVRQAPRRGSRVLGAHLEGPFLNLKLKGAQDGRYIRPGTVAEIDRLLAEGEEGWTWHITVAPEIPGHAEAIRYLVSRGVVVSAGHTECTYEQMQGAIALGVSHVTHLYNAMRGLHHREPGTVGAALALPGITVELIADGIHVHPASMRVAVSARGAEKVLLVTDATEATGLPEGKYRLGELDTIVKDGAVRLEDGTLAGSVLTMADAVRNMVQLVGVPLHEAVAMASLNPAVKHGLDKRGKGSLAAGNDADLVLLDRNLRVTETVVEGEVVFSQR